MLPLRRPIATPLIALFLVYVFHRDDTAGWRLDLDDPTWYQPLTCVFVHSSAAHLINNVAALVVAGGVCEITHGWARTLALFAYTGVGASLAYGFFRNSEFSSRGSDGTLLGASGAVLGLFGAHGALLLLNWHEIFAWARVVWVAGLVLYLIAEVTLFTIDTRPRVAYTAHVFGAVHGVLFGLFIGRNAVLRPWEPAMQRLGGALSLCIFSGSLIGLYN